MKRWELFESIVEESLHNALRNHLRRLKYYDENLTELIDRRGIYVVEEEFKKMINSLESSLWFYGDTLDTDVKIKLQYTAVLNFQNKLKTRILHGI
jgi:hypothetical protein